MLMQWLEMTGTFEDYRAQEADLWETRWRRQDQTLTEPARDFIENEVTVAAIKPDMLQKLRKHVEGRDLEAELEFHTTANGALLRRLEAECACAGAAVRAEPNTLEDFVDSRFDAGDIAEESRDALVEYLDSKTHDRFYWRIRRGMDDLVVLRKKKLRRGVRQRQR